MSVNFGIIFATLVASSANAEEMASLDTILAGQPEKSYQYVRCAGFYLANVEWAGQALDEAAFNDSKSVISALLLVATLQRSEKMGGDVEHLAATVNADTRAVADLYAEDYRQSYATRGTAWDGNPLWESDASTCKPIGELALQMSADLNKGQTP